MAREIIASRPDQPRLHRSRDHRFRGVSQPGRAVDAGERARPSPACPAEVIREMAHTYATAKRAIICWTLGITEHHTAVHNVLSLINLALLTGHVGRWGSGLNPLRGQNNVQGGGDMGALPDRLPGFQYIENDAGPREVRPVLRRDDPAEEGLAPLGHVRRDGARRVEGAVRDRREPAAVGSRSASRDDAARRPRLPGRAGYFPDRDGAARRRGVSRRRGRVRVGGHGHQQRAARAAGAQDDRAARAKPATICESSSTWRAGLATNGRTMPRRCGTKCASCRRRTPG